LTTSFDTLGLAKPLLAAVADEGYTIPTPIQAQAIPLILAGRDVLAAAQTGTGKTAGFTLPLLQLLSRHTARPAARTMRALILTPTRELAAQVEQSVRTYGRHMKLTSTIIFGGVNINPQISALKAGQDIVVATPGRLLDHVGQRTIDLSQVEILVLDEADRMLDMGFINDIKKVLKLLPKQRQNLLFSATFSEEIRTLAHGLLHDAATVEVARRNETAALVTHVIHPVAKESKRDALRDLIVNGDWQQVLVFTRMKHGANRLAEQLCKDGVDAAAIHGNKSQNARTKALAGFKDGTTRVLVATDIAARGLDIEQLPHVVNYELPNVPEDYVHRIGRTGRAGTPGHAVSLVSPDEATYLRDIERVLKRTLPREALPGYGPSDPPRPARNDVPERAAPPPRGRGGRGGRTETASGPRGGNRSGSGASRSGTATRRPHAEATRAPANGNGAQGAQAAPATPHVAPHVTAHGAAHVTPHITPHDPSHAVPRGAARSATTAAAPSRSQGSGQANGSRSGAPARSGARRDRDGNTDPNVRSNLPPGWAGGPAATRRGR
jgi:ATP-dependent RNA helicase RhlE